MCNETSGYGRRRSVCATPGKPRGEEGNVDRRLGLSRTETREAAEAL